MSARQKPVKISPMARYRHYGPNGSAMTPPGTTPSLKKGSSCSERSNDSSRKSGGSGRLIQKFVMSGPGPPAAIRGKFTLGRGQAPAPGSPRRPSSPSPPGGWPAAWTRIRGGGLGQVLRLKLLSRNYFRRLSATSGLTQWGSGSPRRPARRLLAQSRAMALRVSTVALAIWGTMRQFGNWYSS